MNCFLAQCASDFAPVDQRSSDFRDLNPCRCVGNVNAFLHVEAVDYTGREISYRCVACAGNVKNFLSYGLYEVRRIFAGQHHSPRAASRKDVLVITLFAQEVCGLDNLVVFFRIQPREGFELVEIGLQQECAVVLLALWVFYVNKNRNPVLIRHFYDTLSEIKRQQSLQIIR